MLLNFNLVIIYNINKMLLLLKSNLNYLKDNLFECFLRGIIDFYIFKKKFFFITYNHGKFSLKEENIIKDIRNLFILRHN